MHVVTDPRQFRVTVGVWNRPIERAGIWWNAAEVVHVDFRTAESTLLFLEWLSEHQLGRKRLLDTLFASTLSASGITSMLTLNRDDFAVFGVFSFPK